MTNKSKTSLIDFLLKELEKESVINGQTTSKGELLIQNMVSEAVAGDQRMMSNILKFVDKLDSLKTTDNEEKTAPPLSMSDEDIIVTYYHRNRCEINKKIRQRKKENPDLWE